MAFRFHDESTKSPVVAARPTAGKRCVTAHTFLIGPENNAQRSEVLTWQRRRRVIKHMTLGIRQVAVDYPDYPIYLSGDVICDRVDLLSELRHRVAMIYRHRSRPPICINPLAYNASIVGVARKTWKMVDLATS